MKNLFVVFTILFVMNANAGSMQDFQQIGKIEAAMLLSVDENIGRVQVALDLVIENLNEPTSDTEGKIQAAMIFMIEDQIEDLKKQRSELDNLNMLMDADLEPIDKKITQVEGFIAELAL